MSGYRGIFLGTKYICPECHKLADELPHRSRPIREDFGIGRFTVGEDFEELPCECGARFEEAYICECCGEFFTEEELGDIGICEECAESGEWLI